MNKEVVWFEKYRPHTLEDVILPERLKKQMENYKKDNKLPHLGFFSKLPGTGKSSLAKVIIEEFDCDYIWLNASLENGIDVLRNKIQNFASGASLSNKQKIVVLDEFDNFSRDGQAAFRGFIDQFGSKTRFIFTGNYKENIIEPLLDRLEIYDFNQFDPKECMLSLFNRITKILEMEKVKFEKKDLLLLIKENYPKIRKILVEVKKNIQDNELKLLNSFDNGTELVNLLNKKDIDGLKKYVYDINSPEGMYSFLANSEVKVKEQNKMNFIIVLAKYQNMNYFSKDKNLCLLACCYEIINLI